MPRKKRSKSTAVSRPLIVVLGYFYRHNLGDDLYAEIWSRLLSRYHHYDFLLANPDDLKKLPKQTHIVICGGGEIFNDYYLPKLQKLVNGRAIPVYAISLGFPYPQLIEDERLNQFDYILTRNSDTVDLLQELMGPKHALWTPDLATLWPDILTESNQPKTSCNPFQKNFDRDEILERYGMRHKDRKIGVFLAGSFYSKLENGKAYKRVLKKLAQTICSLALVENCAWAQPSKIKCSSCMGARPRYQIYLMAFNTSDKRSESDVLLNRDLFQLIPEELTNIHLIERAIEVEDILTVFKSFELTICARYHAHIFSILGEVPFLSISSTRKVRELLKSINLTELDHSLIVDGNSLQVLDLPNLDKISSTLNSLLINRKRYSRHLRSVVDGWVSHKEKLVIWLNNLIHYAPIRLRRNTLYFERLVDQKTSEVSNLIWKKLGQSSGPVINNILSVYDNFDKEIDESTKRFLARLISFTLLRHVDSDYNWGLEQQILSPDYNLRESVAWILEHFHNKHWEKHFGIDLLDYKTPWCQRKLNLCYFDQNNLENLHRSGWAYVIRHLKEYHRPDGIIFDPYTDKTFGWLRDFYLSIGLLPHRKSWIGIFHHTPEKTYSEDNLTNFFNDSVLIESLTFCRGLIALSQYVGDWLNERLIELNLKVPVVCLVHPTELVDREKRFSWSKFLENPEPKVIQVGAWLRDTYAIYELPDLDFLSKVALKGKAMENYYLSTDQVDQDGSIPMCRNVSQNKYLEGLRKALDNRVRSVTLIEHLEDEDYDQLLSKNVVFIKLIDASAVNTVIECLVRATPIIVNRLPALEEYLGVDYPLFYEDLKEATDLLNNKKKIYAGHKYLSKRDLNSVKIETFLKSLIESELF